jgi:16S rRNA (cytosine967-C5)-methyltransferase
MDANRRTAYFTLLDIESKNAYSNLALKRQIILGKPDSPSFVRQLVYGVLENKLFLDYIIAHYVKTSNEKMKSCEKILLRMGIYQLKFMDRIPPYAAVNEVVALAKRFCRGREGFINAVLRNFQRSGNEIALPSKEESIADYLSVKYSYAPWIVSLWLKEYEPDFVEDLLAAGNRAPDLTIRPNLLRTDKNDLKNRLINKGYQVKEGSLVSDSLHVKGLDLIGGKLYSSGMFSIMDEASMEVVNSLDPKPGELVIDVCAAPGGKTIYIGEKMKNRGEIIAQDIYRRRLNLVSKEAERNGITIIKTRTWDSTRLDSSYEDKADRVLVDAPCSGLGTVRRKPEIKYNKFGTELQDLPSKQLSILTTSSKYVKINGILVYSTCTINPEENGKIIFEFLKRNPHFIREECRQLLPNIDDTDGFYICKMRRK